MSTKIVKAVTAANMVFGLALAVLKRLADRAS